MARAGVGIGLAALAQVLALFLAGAGHGWVAPFFLSAGLWLLIPLTMALTGGRIPGRPVLLLLALIAVAANSLLFERSLGEMSYIGRFVQVNRVVGALIIGLWLGLWFSWQVMVVRAFAVQLKRQ